MPGKVEIYWWKKESMVGSGNHGEDRAFEENHCRMLRSEPSSGPKDIPPGLGVGGSRNTML